MAFHPTLGYAVTPPVPAKVARRNARERNRVKQVNCGFEMLRAHIPSAAKQKKMSKVDTLRHAVEYIQNLQCMLNEKQNFGPQQGIVSQPQPLTPTTPTSVHYSQQIHCNESGYDTASTSSFYSSPQYNTNTSFEYNGYEHSVQQLQPQQPCYTNSHEEDDILDVIAKWQES